MPRVPKHARSRTNERSTRGHDTPSLTKLKLTPMPAVLRVARQALKNIVYLQVHEIAQRADIGSRGVDDPYCGAPGNETPFFLSLAKAFSNSS